MKLWIVAIALCVVALIVAGILCSGKSKNEEMFSRQVSRSSHPRLPGPRGGGGRGYGRPGIPSIPLNIPIPENPEINGETFLDYSNVDWDQLCPSPIGTKCRNYLDCGPSELCVNQAGYIVREESPVQAESAVCVCSIQNACALEGNIC
jgi:hypothetical protein